MITCDACGRRLTPGTTATVEEPGTTYMLCLDCYDRQQISYDATFHPTPERTADDEEATA